MIPCHRVNETKPTLRSENTELEKGSQSESGRQLGGLQIHLKWRALGETQSSQSWHHEKQAGAGLEGASVEAGEVRCKRWGYVL